MKHGLLPFGSSFKFSMNNRNSGSGFVRHPVSLDTAGKIAVFFNSIDEILAKKEVDIPEYKKLFSQLKAMKQIRTSQASRPQLIREATKYEKLLNDKLPKKPKGIAAVAEKFRTL